MSLFILNYHLQYAKRLSGVCVFRLNNQWGIVNTPQPDGSVNIVSSFSHSIRER